MRLNSVRGTLLRLESFDLAGSVFLTGFLEIDIANVSQCTEPGKYIGEFLYGVLVVSGSQRSGELTDLFYEPHERPRHASLAVALLIFLRDKALELPNLHRSTP